MLKKILHKRKTYLITSSKNFDKTQTYEKQGYKIILINSLKNRNDFILLYKKIYKMGYSRVLFETGLTFLNTLIKYKLINDLYMFKSNKMLKKKGKNNCSLKFLKRISLKQIPINLNNDKLFKKEF